MSDTLERDKNDSLDDKLNPANRPDNQHGSTDMSEFEKEFEPGSGSPISGNNLRGRESTGNSASSPISGNNLRGRENKAARKSGDSAADLKNKEETAPDRSDFSNGDIMREKLGLGYTGKGSTKSKGLSKLYGSKSKLKKKVAIAGAAAGGSIVISILLFIALLPLKIEHIVSNLESKFSATSQDAVGKEGDNLLNQYIAHHVLPVLGSKKCHSTVDAGCVALAGGEGPFGRLYKTWSQQKLEQKLATKYKIVFGAQGSGSTRQLYMNVDGHLGIGNADLQAVLKDPARHSIFDIPNSAGSGRASRQDVRQAVRTAFREASLWDRTYTRFKVGKLLETKYGVKRCIIACNVRDKFADSLADKKLSAKALLIRRVIGPASENYSLILQCVLNSGADFCKDAIDPAKSGDAERQSGAQRKIQQQLDEFAAKYGEDSLKALVKTAEDVGKDGIKKVIAREAAKKLISSVAGDAAGASAGEAAEKAVPVIGWGLLIAQVATVAGSIGPLLQHLGYATSAAASVQMFESYKTVASEANSGHIDAAELGSFSDALSTNLAGTKEDSVDATQTPMYNNILGGGSAQSASIFGSLFGGSAYADAATNSKYTCNDGKPVSSGSLVCPEEVFDRGNPALTSVSNFVNGIPGFSTIASIISEVNNVIGEAFSSAFNAACSTVDAVTPFASPCHDALGEIGKATSGLFSWLQDQLLDTPFTDNMSGGRTFDLMAAGADVSANASCKEQLGCAKASSVAVTNIQNQQLAEQKKEFDSQSLFARMFSTDSSYSLVSRMAMDMPTNMLTATNTGVASMLTNPLGKLAGGFAGIFSGNHAFAASTPQADAFGITQNAYDDSQIPSDPEAFWTANCTQGPLALYDDSTDQLDISPWLNNDRHYQVSSNPDVYVDFTSGNYDGKAGKDNTAKNDDTGESENLRTNPCLLVQSSIQSVGGFFDSSLLPKDSLNSEAGSTASSTPATTTSGVTGDAKTLAQKLLDEEGTGKVVLTDSTKSDLQKTVKGQQVYIGDSAQGGGKCSQAVPTGVNATLLQVLLNISAQYKIKIQNIVSGHPCDTLKHSTGHASDIFQINGDSLDDSWWASSKALPIANNIGTIEHDTDPSNAFGLGVGCSATSKLHVPSNITVFNDSCGPQDEIHVDVRGGS